MKKIFVCRRTERVFFLTEFKAAPWRKRKGRAEREFTWNRKKAQVKKTKIREGKKKERTKNTPDT